MKRSHIIFIFFIIITIGSVFVSSCSFGGYDCQCHGLIANKVINIPKWFGCIGTKTCSALSCGTCEDCNSCYGDGTNSILDKSQICNTDVKIVQTNTDKSFDDKFITIGVGIDYDTKKLATAVSFQIKVYDNNVLVGEATCSRHNKYHLDDFNIYDEGSYYGYYNIPIERYIIGEYKITIDEIIVVVE